MSEAWASGAEAEGGAAADEDDSLIPAGEGGPWGDRASACCEPCPYCGPAGWQGACMLPPHAEEVAHLCGTDHAHQWGPEVAAPL